MARKRKRRARGTGSYFWSASDSTWFVRISLGVVNGKRIGKKVRARSERDAQDKLEELRRQYGIGLDPTRDTLGQYLDTWLHGHRRPRESTRVSYAGHIENHIKPLLGGIPLAKLRPSDIRRLQEDRLRVGLSPATVNRIVTTLKMALRQAVDDGILPRSPGAAVDHVREEHEPVAALTETQADAIVDAARGTFMEALVVLLRGSGLRLGEALGLDQGDLHLDDGYVGVRVSKTRVRAVQVSDDAVEALRGHLAAAKVIGPKEPVFLGPRTGKRLRGDTVSHAMPKLLVEAGLARLTPHGMRHGVATLMVGKGVHIRHVAEQLGHASAATTARIYAHVSPEAQRENVLTLNRRKA